MIKGKKGPFILISLLVIAMIFILGMQYGKQVEKTDKVIEYILSITPSQTPMPTDADPIIYKTYLQKDCAVSFVYPSNLLITKEASEESILQSKNKKEVIKLICSENAPDSPTISSREAKLDREPAVAYEDNKEHRIEYRVRSPKGSIIVITVSDQLAPLFENSFSFIQ